MDLLVELAGTDPDLNGPVALPLCVVWTVAALVAIYYRRRYGPNVGYYSAMIMAAVLMAILQLLLFLLSYNNPSVMMARQVVAALGTLLLSWLLISVLTSWSESSRAVNPTYQATRKMNDQPPRLPKLTFLSTPINELEVIYPNNQRLSQLIPESTAPYRIAPQENDTFPAYQPHFSQPRFRYLTTSLQIANTTAFIAAVVGRIAAIFSQNANLELPFIVIACILLGSSFARRPLLVLILLSGLEIPRCVSLAFRSADMGCCLAFLALWPGMLKNVTEFVVKEDDAFEQRGLVRLDRSDIHASDSNASNKRNSAKFATRSINGDDATTTGNDEQIPPTSPRFAMTSRLARTQSALYDIRRTSISSLKRVYDMASPFSTAENAEETRRKSEEKVMQERKRWTITMDISPGESLVDMLQRDLQGVFDDSNKNNLASSLQHPPAAVVTTTAITRNRV
ncbi:hypothetical protein BDF22DRAFT_696858 [Syncephalis plumigaleata]|nr:hypothetical protein BDF22DRAFT_696858 [Syncephalis plumigaleata]